LESIERLETLSRNRDVWTLRVTGPLRLRDSYQHFYDGPVWQRWGPTAVGSHIKVPRPAFYILRSAFRVLAIVFRLIHQYIGTPAAITPRPADATPGASTTVLITIAKLTMQNRAGAQG
jgi:hypothetical protein